jgi:hypothetical protein
MTKRTDDKLVLAVAGRVDAQDEYQKCCEAVVDALRKKRLADARLAKATFEEAQAKEEGATRDQKVQTVKVRRQFEARIKELGCTWDGTNVDAPDGKRFAIEELHGFTVPRENYSTVTEQYQELLDRMSAGLEDCPDTDCGWCHPEVNMVTCSLCHAETPESTAHLHQGEWIGDSCCWDQRLRASE